MIPNQNSKLIIRCKQCRWKESLKGDVFNPPRVCPKCGSDALDFAIDRSLTGYLKRKLGL